MGGTSSCGVADALGMTTVVIHPFAGVLSAIGTGLAGIRALRQVQFDAPLTQVGDAARRLDTLAAEAQAELAAPGSDGAIIEYRAHLRYVGSHQALEVPFDTAEKMGRSFAAAHKARFGFASQSVNYCSKSSSSKPLMVESGGGGHWPGGNGAVRRLRFLATVTVTTLCGSRIVPPLAAMAATRGSGHQPGDLARGACGTAAGQC